MLGNWFRNFRNKFRKWLGILGINLVKWWYFRKTLEILGINCLSSSTNTPPPYLVHHPNQSQAIQSSTILECLVFSSRLVLIKSASVFHRIVLCYNLRFILELCCLWYMYVNYVMIMRYQSLWKHASNKRNKRNDNIPRENCYKNYIRSWIVPSYLIGPHAYVCPQEINFTNRVICLLGRAMIWFTNSVICPTLF